MFFFLNLLSTKADTQQINKYMKKHNIVNLKCPCFLFRYPNLDIPSHDCLSFIVKLPSHLNAVEKTTKIFKALQATQGDPSHGAVTKRSRARATIEGQCVLLQISLQIKMFDFLLNSQRAELVKILETRPQSSKNAQKWIKICKIHVVDKITLLFGFQQLFCVPFLSLAQKT